MVTSIIGILAAMAAPRIDRALSRRDVSAAKAGLGSLILQARVAAVTARRPAVITVSAGMAYVTVTSSLGSTLVGSALRFDATGVAATPTAGSLTVQPTGLVVGGTPFVVVLAKAGVTDSVTVSGYGLVQ
jgi:type II secretory pathway pseudopilin PulG